PQQPAEDAAGEGHRLTLCRAWRAGPFGVPPGGPPGNAAEGALRKRCPFSLSVTREERPTSLASPIDVCHCNLPHALRDAFRTPLLSTKRLVEKVGRFGDIV